MTEKAQLHEMLTAVEQFHDDPALALERRGDRRDGRVYVVTHEISTAVKVAVVTGRPLLISGLPGCGKSSLASYVARNLGLAYYEFTVTSTAQPQDLLWTVDTVRRLNDAQLGLLDSENPAGSVNDYIEPGPLWWCFNPATAQRRGAAPDAVLQRLARPPVQLFGHTPTKPGAVLLIDEIDKADSSFCNGLLVPLGSRQFFVSAIDTMVLADEGQVPGSPIILITTNNERELPDAFVRRCVALSIPAPGEDKLVEIALRHFGADAETPEVRQQISALAKRLAVGKKQGASAPAPSTAEFLDLVRTLLSLKIGIDSTEWAIVEQLIIEKRDVRSSRVLEW
jgi:MoxR-like ATPase